MNAEKFYTFHFAFTNPDTGAADETEFCAVTQIEAINLFRIWAIDDEHFAEVPDINDISIVYNADDAAEYGDMYGKPEDYKS